MLHATWVAESAQTKYGPPQGWHPTKRMRSLWIYMALQVTMPLSHVYKAHVDLSGPHTAHPLQADEVSGPRSYSWALLHFLGLLAKIKCSICSYQFNTCCFGTLCQYDISQLFAPGVGWKCMHFHLPAHALGIAPQLGVWTGIKRHHYAQEFLQNKPHNI